jgi:hypothetical protein
MRLAFQDTGLNPRGVDQVAYDLYGPKGINDAHSMTGYNVFYQSINQDIIEIEDENGKKFVFLPEQSIKIKRKNLSGELENLVIKGNQFIESDIFEGYK